MLHADTAFAETVTAAADVASRDCEDASRAPSTAGTGQGSKELSRCAAGATQPLFTMAHMSTPSVDRDEVLRRAHERQEQQNAALGAVIDARLAAIEALSADAAAMAACEAAGLTASQLEEYGVPPLPVIAPPGDTDRPKRQRAPRGSGSGAPRARRPRAAAGTPAATPDAAGNGQVSAHVGAAHSE
jgi:hypothetical protein